MDKSNEALIAVLLCVTYFDVGAHKNKVMQSNLMWPFCCGIVRFRCWIESVEVKAAACCWKIKASISIGKKEWKNLGFWGRKKHVYGLKAIHTGKYTLSSVLLLLIRKFEKSTITPVQKQHKALRSLFSSSSLCCLSSFLLIY